MAPSGTMALAYVANDGVGTLSGLQQVGLVGRLSHVKILEDRRQWRWMPDLALSRVRYGLAPGDLGASAAF
jgi:hypothetical protein